MRKNTEKAWDALSELTDPELPFLTLNDLGVIRDIKIKKETGELYMLSDKGELWRMYK